MKKRIFLIVLLVVIILSIVLIFNIKDNKKQKNANIDKTFYENEVINLNEKIVTDLSKKDVKKLINKNLLSRYIMVGPDSYLREKITNGNSFDGIDKYYKAQDKYATNIEEIIKNNFSYEIKESVKTDDGKIDVRITYKPYYYHLYLHDVDQLQKKLLKLSGYSDEQLLSGNPTKKMIQDVFRAKVKALEIVDSYLENYVNDYEYFDDSIMYDPNNPKFSQPYIESYLLLADGSASTKFNFASAEFETEQNQRLNKYLTEAAANGTLDKKDPLKLK